LSLGWENPIIDPLNTVNRYSQRFTVGVEIQMGQRFQSTPLKRGGEQR